MTPMYGRLSVIGLAVHREEENRSEAGKVWQFHLIIHCLTFTNIQVDHSPMGDRHKLPTLESKGLERLSELRCYRDWQRLGLGCLDLVNVSRRRTYECPW